MQVVEAGGEHVVAQDLGAEEVLAAVQRVLPDQVAEVDGRRHLAVELRVPAQEELNRPNIDWQDQIHRGILRKPQKYF